MVDCIVSRDCELGTPEGGYRKLRAGDRFRAGHVDYPGLVYRPHRHATEWRFWSSLDIDGAFILHPDFVLTVVILPETGALLREQLSRPGLPFKVSVEQVQP